MKKVIIIWYTVHCVMFAGSAQDSLNYYLETAARNNPAVMAAFHAYEASRQEIHRAGAYEDPRLDMGFFLQPMELVDGRQIAQFQLMQMFPWFGVKKAARTEALHMSNMSFEQLRETRDNLLLEVYKQWYVLNRLQQRWKNNQENIRLSRQLEMLALSKFSSGGAVSGSAMSGSTTSGEKSNLTAASGVGTGGMSGMERGTLKNAQPSATVMNTEDAGGMQPSQPTNPMRSMNSGTAMSTSSGGLSEVLRIQLETAEVENGTESILSELTAEKARFNALLNRPVASEVLVPDTFTLIPYLLDIDAAMQLITGQNPVLGMLREESSAYKAKETMSRKMGYPMFGVGLQYMLIGKRNVADGMVAGMESATAGNMNGKDMLMPMLSVSIPVYRSTYKAAQREAQFRQQAAQAKYQDALNGLEAELYRVKHELDEAERNIALYRQQAELARTAYVLLVQEFVSGTSELSSILQVRRQLSDYRLKESEAIADYNTRVATIQKLISSKYVEP